MLQFVLIVIIGKFFVDATTQLNAKHLLSKSGSGLDCYFCGLFNVFFHEFIAYQLPELWASQFENFIIECIIANVAITKQNKSHSISKTKYQLFISGK